MRVAVLSDIHGNLVALEAVLTALDTDPPDEVWCLGDLVGYGARPSECCRAIEARASICLAGNHDLAVRGTIDLLEFSGDAGAAASWTRTVLTGEARAYLDRLEPQGARADVALFHASARDPVWEYVLSDEAALATLALTEEPIVLVGHSHAALQVSLADDTLAGGLAPAGTELDLTQGRALLNPGSVGQPRDGDPRAAYLLLDLDERTASFRRVDYDIERTQREIRDAGLPEALAARLASGL
ncbi:MAG TPA: metallophosphoesterase family protein [Gaiellaceae bacterium]|jgi:diadenosine tetraphosphatase ApaH/serine/threonine PP2A family protein phosphatase|nr:metallophosphoesterase family protein [Gaiellaceae bacterium]